MLPLKETVKKETVKDRGSKFMGKKIRAEEKARAAQMFLSGRASAQEIGETLGVHRNQIYRWAKKYEENGLEGLRIHYGIRYIEKNPQYSPEQKLKAVVAYQAGEGSQQKICERYGIRSRHALRNWIQVYNRHEDFKTQNGGSHMTKARKTSQKERLEIAKECIESGKNYGETALKYHVSYQQVYTWVKKYSALGEAGLEDRRGQRTGQKEPRTEEEVLKGRIAQLEHELYMTKMERDLLKKVKELERGDH